MNHILEKAKDIKLLICDVDGVLTDGHLIYHADGEIYKNFHVQDGFGLKLLMLSGVELAIITTCASPITKRRMTDLGIVHLYTGQVNKTQAYEDVLQKLNLQPEQVACVGDDLPDLPMIKRSGLGIAVANAVNQCREHADWITEKTGGHGAVREICEMIMAAQNTLDSAFAKYHDK